MELGKVTRKSLKGAALGLMLAAFGASLAQAQPRQTAAPDPDPVKRGEYLFNIGNCASCHTDTKGNGKPLAGGVPVDSPFGTFYGPNISPDPEFGIGKWSEADFIKAFRHGIAPDGSYYYPAFPFTSFTNVSDDDLKDLYAFMMKQAPQKVANKPHDLGFPFNIRAALGIWRALHFVPGPYLYDRAMDQSWNRGAYLVQGITHCGECHTPRNMLGALDKRSALGGAKLGKDTAPNLTSDAERGLGKWSLKEIAGFLEDGITPSGDVVGGKMSDVIKHTAKLTPEDRMAIAVYLKSVPPVIGR